MADMLTQLFESPYSTLHKDRMYDEIYCFAEDHIKHNKWIAVFRRMGVRVFDMSEGTGKAKEQRP
jgi:hypothetical protein